MDAGIINIRMCGEQVDGLLGTTRHKGEGGVYRGEWLIPLAMKP
jgi:hypothetical protein